MPLTAQEQRELDELELKDLEAKAGRQETAIAGNASPEPTAPAQASRPPTADEIPSLSAYEPTFWERAKEELRNSLSPILGESHAQALQRKAALAHLDSISPTLASMVSDAVPEAAKEFQRSGISHQIGTAFDIGTQTGGAVAGARLGAMAGPFAPVAIPLLAGIGGAAGNYVGQRRRVNTGEQEAIKPGELAAAGAIAAIPGGNMAATGAGPIISQALKQGAGGLGAEALRTAIDEGRLPTVREAAWASILPAMAGAVAEKIQQASPEISAARAAAEGKVATKAATLAGAQAEGMVGLPSSTNPSMANKVMEGLAGKSQLQKEASAINQSVADDIARRILDPTNPDLELTSKVAQAVRQRAYTVGYQPIASIGPINADAQYVQDLGKIVATRSGAASSFPGLVNKELEDTVNAVAVTSFDAAAGLKAIQVLRDGASEAFAAGRNEIGFAKKEAARALEDQIERHLSSVGTPAAAEILSDYRAARKLMAQAHTIEDAIREGGGGIMMSSLARRFQAGAKLSDGLETVGAFSNMFPGVTREVDRQVAQSEAPKAVSKLGRVAQGAIMAGVTGAATHSPEAAALAGAAGAAMPSVRGMLRSMILSEPYQRIMTKIPVTVEANPDLGALIIRQGAQAEAEQTNN